MRDMGTMTEPAPVVQTAIVELSALFNALPRVMFFVKDRSSRYIHVNAAFLDRIGAKAAKDVIGRFSSDVLPPGICARSDRQDERIAETGSAMVDELERVEQPLRFHGWYVTTKVPLRDNGEIVAVAGISRELTTPSEESLELEGVSKVVRTVKAQITDHLRIDDLARVAECSPAQLDRRMRTVFGLSMGRYVAKVRVDHAATLLSLTDLSLAAVATESGFYDQSEFTRRFCRHTGETPAQYRATHRTVAP